MGNGKGNIQLGRKVYAMLLIAPILSPKRSKDGQHELLLNPMMHFMQERVADFIVLRCFYMIHVYITFNVTVRLNQTIFYKANIML